MRMSLPIFWCVDAETKGLLASMVSGIEAIPKPEWVKWATGEPVPEFRDYEKLFDYMKRPPKHPVRMR